MRGRNMKKAKLILLTALMLVLQPMLAVTAAAEGGAVPIAETDAGAIPIAAPSLSVDAKSCILMEASTGEILYESEADRALPPASVTKIMSILLIMEAVKAGKLSMTDTVSVSANAASMGGSQVYLEPGEEMTVEELLKCVIIASANDATVALAEHVAGSEEAFVAEMNRRAGELEMKNTHFVNTNGLDDAPDAASHLTSARDIAIMSRELINNHPEVFKYTTVWMDSIRGGAFGLTNTNRLIRFYRGATGLKTGSTSKAGFCISATAERDGLSLIAVIMGSPTRDVRNECAKTLLDYGFANYSVYKSEGGDAGEVSVCGGVKGSVAAEHGPFSVVMKKGTEKGISVTVTLYDNVEAPVKKGDTVGAVSYTLDGEIIGEVPAVAREDVPKIGYFGVLYKILSCVLGK